MLHVIDRRSNPGQKSLENRQRFLRRAKAHVQKAVHEATGKGKIKDVLGGGSVSIPIDGVNEPRLHREGGIQNRILPGNKKYAEGDFIPRQGESSGGGSDPGEGDATDAFRFVLTRDEFVDLFLDDLELPNMTKKTLNDIEQKKPRRAGYSMSGSPTAMAIPRTIKHSMMRRFALKGGIKEKIRKLEEEWSTCTDPVREQALLEEIEECKRRLARIAFIDPIDIRYRRFEQEPTPIAQAVMFCLMDVSGSMSEHMKDLAKRFYMLLYVFLTRKYRRVEVVFIRHTDNAEEVDENTFFYGPASGGTTVSSALEAMQTIVKERYNPAQWNIFAAQASDGDNKLSDADRTSGLMTNLLKLAQYVAYLEVAEETTTGFSMTMGQSETSLWTTYLGLCAKGAQIAMRKVKRRADIFPVFQDLFKKEGSKHAEVA